MNTVIVNCNCKHEYQDKQYGKGRRVANVTTKEVGKNKFVATCTVCNKEK